MVRTTTGRTSRSYQSSELSLSRGSTYGRVVWGGADTRVCDDTRLRPDSFTRLLLHTRVAPNTPSFITTTLRRCHLVSLPQKWTRILTS